MGIVSWIILGGLAGWLASIIMKRNSSMGIGANIIVGVLGALIGGFLTNYFLDWEITGFNIQSFLIALLGSILLLAIINLFKRGKVVGHERERA